MTMNGAPTLDARIADTLATTEHLSPEFINSLYDELDNAVGDADQIARDCRVKSIDPLCRDGIAERSRAEDQEFIANRLRAAATPMRAKYQAALAREREAAWIIEADAVELEAAQVADQIISTYPMVTNILVQLFTMMKSVDQKVDRINLTAPNGVMRRLRHTEATARGIADAEVLSITKSAKLPTLVIGRGAAADAWPPAPPNIYLEYVQSVAAGIASAPAPLTEDERIAASQRQVAHGEAMEREHQRLNSEAAARTNENNAEARRVAAG
jgi:hypothetical protein